MEKTAAAWGPLPRTRIRTYFKKMYARPIYRLLLILLGLPTTLMVLVKHLVFSNSASYDKLRADLEAEFKASRLLEKLRAQALESERNKSKFLKRSVSDEQLKVRADKVAKKKYDQALQEELTNRMRREKVHSPDMLSTYLEWLDNPAFFWISVITSLPMYLLVWIYSKPYAKYISERLFMMIFVMIGVIVLVFTILYLTPMDPARNILGANATAEKVAEFKRLYGLDQPYLVQLGNTIKKFFTLDLGISYVGNEDIASALMRRFPITVQLSLASMLVSILIAIPSGIISSIKQYSAFDYIFMLVALLGLSIPNFWLGLILILNFSIRLGWLPAMYDATRLVTLIMPAIVMGTGLSASVARMTRSSMLEVKNQDYILTARAKGLSESRVIFKHILGNAMIPIVTVIGLQFGGILGGSATTEKVFNVNGLGKYIVDKQFIPDIPVVMAGVVYIAIVISIVNLLVDILYAFLDPRIKSSLKNY